MSRRETMLATNVSNNKIGVTGNFLKDRDDKISLEPILLLCLRLYNILIWETAPPPPAQPCCDITFLWGNWLYSGSSCRFITGVTLKYHLFNQESNFRNACQTSKPPFINKSSNQLLCKAILVCYLIIILGHLGCLWWVLLVHGDIKLLAQQQQQLVCCDQN